ncbi:hypothetical protein HED63_24545 [Ochrobactrum cytisi]|nr:hypothetical protein [Brucella cytisi]
MKLDQILRHSLFPFADFRTNDASFRMLEFYWAAVVRDALGQQVQALVAPLQFADQDTENWGDPLMFDFWIPNQRRGTKLVLAENTGIYPLVATYRTSSTAFPRSRSTRAAVVLLALMTKLIKFAFAQT